MASLKTPANLSAPSLYLPTKPISTVSDVFPEANLIRASSTSSVLVFTEVVVPLTVKSPPTIMLPAVSVLPVVASTVKLPAPTSTSPTTVRSWLIVVVPPPSPPVPMLTAVAAPNALTVVAVAFNRLNVV